MSPFNSCYLTQNYHSTYVERSSGKTHMYDKSMTSLDVCKMKAYCLRKNRCQSQLISYVQSTKLSYQWFWNICHMGWMFSKQVVTDPVCEQWVHTSYCSPNEVKEMVTNVCTMLLKCVGNYNRLCLKCSNCHKLMINHRLSYKLALHIN